jgi:hypothetical protein
VRYLVFECFEIHKLDEIETSILSGDYILLNYAATQWLDQVKQCAEGLDDSDEISDFCQEVDDFVAKRQNLDYEGPCVANRPRFGCLELPRGACCCLKGPTSA